MRKLIAERSLEDEISVESAGTGNWHIGQLPDYRAVAEAERRGIAMESRARQVTDNDFEVYDLIVAMDASNLEDLRELADHAHHEKFALLREHDPHAAADLNVPDPYYGGPDGFAEVFDLVERSCRVLLDKLEPELADPNAAAE